MPHGCFSVMREPLGVDLRKLDPQPTFSSGCVRSIEPTFACSRWKTAAQICLYDIFRDNSFSTLNSPLCACALSDLGPQGPINVPPVCSWDACRTCPPACVLCSPVVWIPRCCHSTTDRCSPKF